MTPIYEWYSSANKKSELEAILTIGAQQHPLKLRETFLEKDLWVTEILRLLYDDGLLGHDMDVAFKGGTALSKCWRTIERFSEDIDLSIHWADLAGSTDESADWAKTTKNPSQSKKFRKQQTERLTHWSRELAGRLNERLTSFSIEGLFAELDEHSSGEKIRIHYPAIVSTNNAYQLDHVLLEFGGRNRGRPSNPHTVTTYLSDVPELESLGLPSAIVNVYDQAYILWEKLTALHQYSTQEKNPTSTDRLARHWYDVDQMLRSGFPAPQEAIEAMEAVIEMKSERWPQPGVNYRSILNGGLVLVPDADRYLGIEQDHNDAVEGGMFYNRPDSFRSITDRLSVAQEEINQVIGRF